MTTPDPEPTRTPGLEPGGQVSPGETPPAEGDTFGTHPDPPELRKGWGAMPLIVTMVVVVLVVVGLIAMAISL